MNQGKFVIVAMVAVGLSMAVFAWWARYEASQRVLDRFGADVAIAVRNGKQVELLTLSKTPPTDKEGANNLITIPNVDGGEQLFVTKSQEITDAPGLIHARHHLLHENGFNWEEPRSTDSSPNWTHALRFTHDEGVATWILDFADNRAYIVERKTEVGMGPIASSLKQFLDEL